MDINGLLTLSTSFRTMIDECYFLKDKIPFCWFPKGCCGTTSDLLAYYLQTNGITGINLVSGKMSYHGIDDYTHQWLEMNSTIIDITADQFKEYNRSKVYVGEKDAFYSLFSIVSSKRYDENFELGDLNDELPWYYMHITVRSKNNS